MAQPGDKTSRKEMIAAIQRRLGMNEGSKGISAHERRGVATRRAHTPMEDTPGWQWNKQGNRTRGSMGRQGMQLDQADKKGNKYGVSRY